MLLSIWSCPLPSEKSLVCIFVCIRSQIAQLCAVQMSVAHTDYAYVQELCFSKEQDLAQSFQAQVRSFLEEAATEKVMADKVGLQIITSACKRQCSITVCKT